MFFRMIIIEEEKTRLNITISKELVDRMDKDMTKRFLDSRSVWITEAILLNLKKLEENKISP